MFDILKGKSRRTVRGRCVCVEEEEEGRGVVGFRPPFKISVSLSRAKKSNHSGGG